MNVHPYDIIIFAFAALSFWASRLYRRKTRETKKRHVQILNDIAQLERDIANRDKPTDPFDL